MKPDQTDHAMSLNDAQAKRNTKISARPIRHGLVWVYGNIRIAAQGWGLVALVIFILCTTAVIMTNGYPTL